MDDTIEIRSQSKEAQAVFLKRIKLAKGKGTLLNNSTRLPRQDFISDADLKVGGTVDVYGRNLFLYDCDTNTKNYYKEKYGIEFVPVQVEGAEEEKLSTTQVTVGGVHKWCANVWQTQRQGLSSFVEAPPKKNFQKMLDNDRKTLRFAGTLVSKRPEDKDRIFIISYYLADDTISIFEPPQR